MISSLSASRSSCAAPSTAWRMRSRTASERSSVAPTSLKVSALSASESTSPVGIMSLRHAAMPKSNADEPLMRVRSRSKNAAALAAPAGRVSSLTGGS
jgi:hypothetical protein